MPCNTTVTTFAHEQRHLKMYSMSDLICGPLSSSIVTDSKTVDDMFLDAGAPQTDQKWARPNR